VRISAEQVRQAYQLLLRHRRFSALAIACIGLAVALNTTMYSVLDAMINPTVAMEKPEQLFRVTYYGDYRGLIPTNEKNAALSAATFHTGAAGREPSVRESIAERGNRIRDANVVNVTPNYFDLLGVRPSAGRLIGEGDMRSAIRPVVIAERLWKRLFPDLPEFEQSEISIAGQPRMVIGLLPYRADFPGSATDVWQLPLPHELPSIRLSIVRLRDDVTVAQAEAQLRTLTLRYQQRTGYEEQAGFRILSATKPPFRPLRFHWAMIGSVVTVLLIACANLANLQLARGVSRARELATRSAVGASRRDIIVQLSLECALLALAGLALAAIVTVWGFQLVDASVPRELAGYVTTPVVSWRVLAFAVGATLFCLALVGVAPAIRLSRVDLDQVLKSGAGTGKSPSTRRQYGILVVVEVALAVSLLSSAALLGRAAWQVNAFRLAHDSEGLITSFLYILRERPDDNRTQRQWSDLVVQRALMDTNIVSAATVMTRGSGTILLDDPAGAPLAFAARHFNYEVVSPDFLRTMRYPIVRGRDFSPEEFAEPAAIVDEGLARHFWPGADPIGRLIKLGRAESAKPWVRVVGVARVAEEWFNSTPDERTFRFGARSPLDSGRSVSNWDGRLFLLHAADTNRLPAISPSQDRRLRPAEGVAFALVARGKGDARRHLAGLNAGLGQMGSHVRFVFPMTWEERSGVARVRARQNFMATLFISFALIALILAALGVYAIIAHTVAQRAREFGVRLALGAGIANIRAMVLREGNILGLTGVAIGLGITYYSASLLRTFLFSDYDRYDSRVFAVVALLIMVVAWASTYIPALRAARINPVEALRND